MKIILILLIIGLSFYFGILSFTSDKNLIVNTNVAKEVFNKGVDKIKNNVVIFDKNS